MGYSEFVNSFVTATNDLGNNFRVVPAISYQLPAGPATQFVYVPQTGTIPIISSDVSLRSYSPFTISLLPPLFYLQNPELLLNQSVQTSVQPPVGGVPTPPLNLGIIGKVGTNSIPNFRDTVRQLRDPTLNNSQANQNGQTRDKTQQAQKVIGGRLQKPATGSNGGTTPINKGLKPAISDVDVARDIAAQLSRLLNVPPLTLYINPNNFSLSFTKIQQYSERTRTGYVYQTWGEEQPKLSVSGRIGAFLAGRSGSTANAVSGVQFASKRDSASFQQLMNLLVFFKNNGYIKDTIGKALAPQLIGIVSIEYDQNTYLGYFDSFSWGYNEQTQNGGIEFSFEFTVTQQYDNAQSNKVSPLSAPTVSPSDPSFQRTDLAIGQQPITTYGLPQPPTLPALPIGLQRASQTLTNTAASFAVGVGSVSTSASGFKTPPVAPALPPNQVVLQPFFDPRSV